MSEDKWLRYQKNKAHVWVRLVYPSDVYAVPICARLYHSVSLLREDPTAPHCRRCEAKLAKEGKHDTR